MTDDSLTNELHYCSLCGQPFRGFGNNPEPLADFDERCCDTCNASRVIPARLRNLSRNLRGD